MFTYHKFHSDNFRYLSSTHYSDNPLVHVEEYITTAITVPLNNSFLRLWYLQVVVRQPRLLLHVIHIADVMTLCTEKWSKFKYKRLRKANSVSSNIRDGTKYSYRDKPRVFILDSTEEKTAAHLSYLNLLKKGSYKSVTPENFYSQGSVKAHQRKSCLQCDWRHWWVWKSWPGLHSVNNVCHQVTKDKNQQ